MGWHIVITEEMRAMGLSGNNLVVFALINGFSQNGQGCFYGSLAYVCETCGIAKRTAVYILQGLVERGFVTKTETYHNGVMSVAYQVSANYAQGVQKMHRGSAENAPNNIEINIDNTLSIKGRTRFQKPTLEEIRHYCQERGNSVDPEKFFNFYESKGWVVGKSPMKDWKAAVRTWEQRPDTPIKTPSRKKSVFEQNIEVIDQMYGTDMHSQIFGEEVCDER